MHEHTEDSHVAPPEQEPAAQSDPAPEQQGGADKTKIKESAQKFPPPRPTLSVFADGLGLRMEHEDE